MADRYAFQSPFSQGSGSDPWFTVGSVAVTTTVAVTALGLFGILLVVIEGGYGAISEALLLDDSAITRGQLWRFVSWPIPPASDPFWALLGLIFFFLIGTQFETMLGRRAFTSLIAAIVVIPAVLATLVGVIVDDSVPTFGLGMIFLGIAAGFAASMPQARSFFNIPFWVLVAFFFFVQFLQLLASRSLTGLVMLTSTAFIGLVMTRSLGFANVQWIPTMPLPGFVTGAPTTKTSKPAKPEKRRKSKGGANLTVVPPSSSSEAEIDALLDQVNEQGLDSLTKKQKQTLESHAKEMRKRRET
jgi:hypothetical protein